MKNAFLPKYHIALFSVQLKWLFIKFLNICLPSVAPLVGLSSMQLKGGWFHSCQGTYLDFGFHPWWGCMQEAAIGFLSHIEVSYSPPPALSLPLSKVDFKKSLNELRNRKVTDQILLDYFLKTVTEENLSVVITLKRYPL